MGVRVSVGGMIVKWGGICGLPGTRGLPAVIAGKTAGFGGMTSALFARRRGREAGLRLDRSARIWDRKTDLVCI